MIELSDEGEPCRRLYLLTPIMDAMKCDIILPVCDEFKFTKNCIESIVANTDTPYRLIVVNNGKNPDTKSYLAEVKGRLKDALLLIENPYNFGWVKAVNQGIAVSSAPFLCFQNDDTVVTKGWLRKMIGILQANPEIGVVNPAWEGRPSRLSIEKYGDIIEKKYRGKYIETDWARGFSVVFKRAVVEKIGGLDEIYGLAYFDDVDFSVRAINAGFLVVVALDTYVYHHRNVTFFQILKGKKWNELHEKNKIIYYKRWGKPLKVVIVLDRETCENETGLERIIDTAYYLARRQHRIYIWCPCDVSRKFRHTNIRIKSCRSTFLLRLKVFFDLWSKGRKKTAKRYDAIFSFDKRFERFANAAGQDLNDYIKKTVDALKERSRDA